MILVTGGTGFLGSHLLYNLCKSGHSVRAIKRKNSSLQLTKKVFSYYDKNPETLFSKIEWVEGDVLDIFSLLDALEGIKQVYHTAAIVSFEHSQKDTMMKTNVNGTANVVNAALEKKVSKLCFVSSIASLGRASGNKPIDEETHFTNSVNPSAYSISKFESEREVWRGISEGLNAVIINPSIILGPGNWDDGSAKLFQTVYKGLKFYTTGSNGFVDVNDVAQVMILLMESRVKNERFIVNAENVTYKSLFTMMAEALGVTPPNIKAGSFMSAVYWRVLKAKSLFTGKTPAVTKETANTARQHYQYNNKKLLKSIDFEYTPVSESVRRAGELFLKDKLLEVGF